MTFPESLHTSSFSNIPTIQYSNPTTPKRFVATASIPFSEPLDSLRSLETLSKVEGQSEPCSLISSYPNFPFFQVFFKKRFACRQRWISALRPYHLYMDIPFAGSVELGKAYALPCSKDQFSVLNQDRLRIADKG